MTWKRFVGLPATLTPSISWKKYNFLFCPSHIIIFLFYPFFNVVIVCFWYLIIISQEVNQREREGQLDKGFLSEVNAQLRNVFDMTWHDMTIQMSMGQYMQIIVPSKTVEKGLAFDILSVQKTWMPSSLNVSANEVIIIWITNFRQWKIETSQVLKQCCKNGGGDAFNIKINWI